MTPYYEQDGIVIYHGDCRESLSALSVDHVITDPPYDSKTHDGARTGGDGQTVLRIDFAPVNADLAYVSLLLAAAARWVVAFCSMEQLGDYKRASGACWVRAGFWRRTDGCPQFTGDRPGQPGEGVAVMHREGKKVWNGGGRHAYWICGVERNDRAHPTQKPESLMRDLVADFTTAGETILDPFMGSGTTLVAAKRLGRKAIGIELEERYCEIAAKRLAQGALDLFGEASA